MRNLYISSLNSASSFDPEAVAIAAAAAAGWSVVTVVDEPEDADLRLTIGGGGLCLTNHGARGYILTARLEIEVNLLEGFSASSCRAIAGHAKASQLVSGFDGFWSPLLAGYEVGAPAEELAGRLLAEVLAEIEAIDRLAIESILARPLRIVSSTPVSADAALLAQIEGGEEMNVTLRLPGDTLHMDFATGASQAEAKENLREIKRRRLPLGRALEAVSSDELDALLRARLRRIQDDVAVINSTILVAEKTIRPEYYRRAAQDILCAVWGGVDDLLQSVEERRPTQSTVAGYSLKYIRLGVIEEGFGLKVTPREEKD